MVKIAIAGGTGQVAKEVIDALLATNHHNITILSRKADPDQEGSSVRYRTVNYDDREDLTKALNGVHTVLSFLQPLVDTEGSVQKTLIDAAVAAGVKRFAPSEYGSASIEDMPWWIGKQSARGYLEIINRERKVLEYTLFQPGLFLNYLAFPYKTSKHIDPLQSVFDFQNCRAIMVDGHEDAVMTLTTVTDLADIIVHAIDDQREWPEVGGIRGNRLTFSKIIEIGEKIRGHSFMIQKVRIEDLEAGVLDTTWALEKKHQAVSNDQANDFVKTVTVGMLISSMKGAWDVSDDFNQRFPTFDFTTAEDFLTKVWKDKE